MSTAIGAQSARNPQRIPQAKSCAVVLKSLRQQAGQDGRCQVTLQALAARTGYSYTTVRRAVHRLQLQQSIAIISSGGYNGEGLTYELRAENAGSESVQTVENAKAGAQ